MRHAERFELDFTSKAASVPLTEKGHRDAYETGKMLELCKPVHIYHSPAPRCRQTADDIFMGMMEKTGRVFQKGVLPWLGGAYLRGDRVAMIRELEKLGDKVFLRKWFDGTLDQGFLMPLEEAAVKGIKSLTEQLSEGDASYVNITHDWNITILREYVFKLRHEDIGLPDFLDFIAAQITDSKLHLYYHDYERSIPLPLS